MPNKELLCQEKGIGRERERGGGGGRKRQFLKKVGS